MEHLCSKLSLIDIELKQKIWTVFEESIRNSDLIKDRHLDQLLMCAIYVICRILNIPPKFQDIMKFYREQPQCTSSVYRDVLLSRETVGTGKIFENPSVLGLSTIKDLFKIDFDDTFSLFTSLRLRS